MPRAIEGGWSREFYEPILLPKGRHLVTLKDAATYIMRLPETEHAAPEWQSAMEALLLVAEQDGPTIRRHRRHASLEPAR